jgi:hypothetical protein
MVVNVMEQGYYGDEGAYPSDVGMAVDMRYGKIGGLGRADLLASSTRATGTLGPEMRR